MNNFEYFVPTKVVFGKAVENKTAQLIKEAGGTKVLVHFGGGSVKRSGLLDRVYKILDDADIRYVSLGGVVPNPELSKVREGIDLCKTEHVDFILAVGGGSVIDSAKAIGYGIANNVDVWDIYSGKAKAKACAPIGTILTIAAAGSEMSNSSVITNVTPEGHLKRGYTNDLSRCKFAVMNPELTETLPEYQTMCGCTDIIMHTFERWFGLDGIHSELTDEIAAGLLHTVMKNALLLKKDLKNYDARAEVMWAGSLSHNGLTDCGSGYAEGARPGDWATHQLGHELTSLFGVTHGASLAAVWGSWARYVYKVCPERFAKLAEDVAGIIPDDNESYESLSLKGISAMEEFFSSIGMPTSIHDFEPDITDEQIHQLAVNCSFNETRTIGQFKKLNVQDMENIYKAAK